MTGQEFFDKYGSDVTLLHQFVSSHLAGVVLIPAVPVRPEAVDKSGTLSSVGSSSLGVLMRMKTRVDSLGKDIAEAIAAVKLEQEEEFVDSAPDWAQ
ncbi:hypothetical protein R1sor_012324 [Riccia sorocarpa]|uniref:Uncharacterized protein n=1 Tax=Riccia sorocarpa TaxID=122646 RepID=A0ABD3HJ41_9MARC